MPLFSEHISNMYYGGSPSYTSPSYGYKSSYTPLGTSYSASYLNPGGNYSSHSSLSSYSRSPLSSRWIPGMSRSYSPMLTTITERGTSSPLRVNSPRRIPISKRTYGTPYETYIQRPININTADIDVSRDKYRHKPAEPTSPAYLPTPQRNDPVDEKDDSPFMPRVDGKPEEGVDSSPGIQRSTIKRGRTVVRFHTIKRKDRDSPRKPMESSQPPDVEVNTLDTPDIPDDSVELEPKESLTWREKLSEDLTYVEKREKKSLGTKLVEKFIVKDINVKDNKIEKSSSDDKPQRELDTYLPNFNDVSSTSKSPDRRCSMELLAEQANLLDSLIRGENLSTAPLDLSKIGVASVQDKFDPSSSIKRRKTDNRGNPLKTTKSDYSLHDNLKSSMKMNKDSKVVTKGRSLKKSQSGGSICRLDSITEFPKEPINQELPPIEESRLSQKSEETKEKPKMRNKITASVEISPPVSPLKFRIENVIVEEKHHKPKKEISFTYEVEDVPLQEITLEGPKAPLKRTKERSSVKKKSKKIISTLDAESPEPEEGNFWDKIGKRETVYLIKRKQHIDETKEKNKRLLSWFPEVEETNSITTVTYNTDLNEKNNDSLNQGTDLTSINFKSDSSELLPEVKNINIDETKIDEYQNVSRKLEQSQSSENMQTISLTTRNSSLKENITKAKEPNYDVLVHDNTITDNTPCNSDLNTTKNINKNSHDKLDEEVTSISNEKSCQKTTEKALSVKIKDETENACEIKKNTESKLSLKEDCDLTTSSLPSISTKPVTDKNEDADISKAEVAEISKHVLESIIQESSVSIEKPQPETLPEENSNAISILNKTTITTTSQTQAKSGHSNIDEHSMPLTRKKDIEKDNTWIDTNFNKETSLNTTQTIDLIPQLKEPSGKNTEIQLEKDDKSMKQIIPESENAKNSTSQEVTGVNSKKKIVKTVAKKVSEKKKDVKPEENSSISKSKVCKTCKKFLAPASENTTKLDLTSNREQSPSNLKQENKLDETTFQVTKQIDIQEVKTVLDCSNASSSISNLKAPSDTQMPIAIESKDIPNEIEATNAELGQNTVLTQEKKSGEEDKAENETKESPKKLKAPSIKEVAKITPKKPIKEERAVKPLIATPRPLQKRAPQVIHSSESSDSSSDEDSSDNEDSESSEDSTEFFECEVNPDGRTSTGSNDSGFDSSAPTSPASFLQIKKGGGDSSGPSTSNASLPVTDILERELEQSTAYGIFRKTGRFTPPARSIPRFRKYTIEDFQFIKVLGKGSFGKVLLAELRETEYYYAVKCLKKDVVLEDDDVECTLIERKVLALGTNHPYLCHLFATFQTDSHLFFVMEYLNGGDLMFHIQQSGRFPEARARFYGAEIVSGLKFLHKRGIVYRDLKLDNILLDFDGHVRIADFGMCKLQIYLDKTADTFCGTPDYMAPEIIKGLKYNQTVDWWSFGVLLYEMLIGQSPFSGCDEDELFWSICNEMPSYPRFLSREGLTILTRLLDKDARTRLGGTECMHGDVREQEFFHPVHWDKLERRELEAPFRPRVRHPLDTQYFDRAFTGERPRLTAVEPQVLRSMDQEPFRGFSYTNPNATDR